MIRANTLKILALVLFFISCVPASAQSDDQRRAQEMADALQAATRGIQDMNAQIQAQRAANEAAAAERANAEQAIRDRDRQRFEEQMAVQRAAQQAEMDRIAGSHNSASKGGFDCPAGTCASAGCYSGGTPCRCIPNTDGHSCGAQ